MIRIKAVFAPLQVVIEISGIGNRHVHVHVIPVHGFYDLVPKDSRAAHFSSAKQDSP